MTQEKNISYAQSSDAHDAAAMHASLVESDIEALVYCSINEMLTGYADEKPWINALRKCTTFSDMLATVLTEKLTGSIFTPGHAAELVRQALAEKTIYLNALSDLHAYVIRDPAAAFYGQPLLFFKGFHAIQLHRIAHYYWQLGEKFVAFAIQSHTSDVTGVDFHPAATIGNGLFMDHATGVVVGSTALIGDNVSIFHGVTLGSVDHGSGKRHPTIKNGVLIGAGAVVLGNITIGDGAKLGAGCVVVKDVPAYTTVVGMAAKPVLSSRR